MPRSQAEELLAVLARGRRLTKWIVRDELHIENVGRCVAELREAGWPIATVWLDVASGEVALDDRGKPLAWLGHKTSTQQPRGAVAAYQLYCPVCCDLSRRISLLPGVLLLPDAAQFVRCTACRSGQAARQRQLSFA